MATDAVATEQIDNDVTNVTEWCLPPGASTGRHRHERDYVVVPLATGQLTLTTPDGERTTSDITAGQAYFRRAGAEHDVSNATGDTIVFVEIEIK